MTDFIIIAIVAALIVVGILSGKKHFKGEGGCCGGGNAPEPIPEKKLGNVIGTKIVLVDGMTCEHCKNWVEKSINNIDGAAGKVNLKKSEAVVLMEREVSDAEIRAAIENAGYKVREIRCK